MRTFALVTRGAPSAIGGLGLSSLDILCGAKAIHHLVSLFTSCTPSKLLSITAIEFYQLEIGVEGLFLRRLYTLLSALATSTWITHLWEFLQLYKLKNCLPTLVLPSAPCSNDATLIGLLISFGWEGKRFRLGNHTRLWSKVYFVSDLLLLGINRINRCFLQGERCIHLQQVLLARD